MTEQRKPRVVLADDEGHSRMLIKAVMTSMKCEIAGEALNGREAVDLFKKEKPDLMLLDINMPLMTGKEALKEIMNYYQDAFVIMLTSVADMESVEKCLDMGAANYILKGTPVQEIKSIIKETWQTFRKKQKEGNADA